LTTERAAVPEVEIEVEEESARRVHVIAISVAAVVGFIGAAVFAGYVPWPSFNAGPEAVGVRGEAEGSIARVDSDSRVLTVARGIFDFSPMQVSVTRDTNVEVDGKIGAFGDLREGTALRICYEVQASGRWARAIQVPPSQVPCGALAAPAREEPVRPVAEPAVTPAPQVAAPIVAPPPPPAPAPAAASPAVRPDRAVVQTNRPAPAPAPIATRPASPPKARTQDAAPPARTQPAESDEAPSRRLDAPARSGEDYGAVIDWLLKR
jgi:hypothetical protein